MPINGPATYIPTTNEFIAHWVSVNEELDPAGPLALRDGEAVEDLTALRDLLGDRRAEVEAARNGREEARALLEASKALLLDMLNRFNTGLEAATGDPQWRAMRPRAFSQSDGMAKVIGPLDDVADVWERYEAETGTAFTLLGGTTRAVFNTGLNTLRTRYAAYTSGDNGLKLARSKRTETEQAIHPILVKYRKAIPARFEEGSPLFETMPRLSPLPGSTPDPVSVSGTYDAGAAAASLAWTESADPALVEYEVRGVAGPDYEAEDEVVVANIAPAAPRTWTGTFGLGVPGAAASFRVYVTTATGNERASNTVTVTRPPEG